MNYKGTAHKVGEHIDTDAIIPARFLVTSDAKELGANCMAGLEPDWVKRVKPGDIMVAGRNFGCGSSREHAAWACRTGLRPVEGALLHEHFQAGEKLSMWWCSLLYERHPKMTLLFSFDHKMCRSTAKPKKVGSDSKAL